MLSDFCEKNLAAAFAPELATAESDETGAEPKWVAKPLDESRVRIAYLLSYYVDYGPVVSCVVPDAVEFFFGQEACQGHFGDSEMIVLEVYYNPVTQHWLLDRAIYSAHKNYNTYSRGSSAYPTALYYPAKTGGIPSRLCCLQQARELRKR